MINMKVGTLFLLVGGKQSTLIIELKLVHPMGMEVICLEITELVEANLGMGIQIQIIQAGMTNLEIHS